MLGLRRWRSSANMELCWLIFTFLILIVYPALFIHNATVRFYSKVFVHYINLFMASTLPIPLGLLRPNDVRNTNFCSFVLRNLSRVFAITWKIQGLEHLAVEDAVVITCNHQSSLDVIGMMELWPKLVRAAPVVKRELLFAGPFGLMAYLSGTVFVDRSNPTRARTSLNNALDYLTDKKIKLWLFPEGTRNESGTMLPFKKGAFHMAMQAQVPIVPMVISSYSSFYDSKKKKFDNGGQVNIVILPPVPTKGLTADDMDKLIDSVRKPMLETFNKISGFKTEASSNGTADK